MLEKTIDEMYGALVNYGGDPMLVETEDAAIELLTAIKSATSIRLIKDADERRICKKQLNLEDFETNKIWSFVNGSEFIVCFDEDWKL